MYKSLLIAIFICLQPSAQAGWVYFENNYGTAYEYYFAPVENKGSKKVIRTFTYLPVDAKAPISTPKATVKVTLYPYGSEQSTYEVNCKEQTIQLMSRIFYRDPAGQRPFITHNYNDPFIQSSNSEFAKQFIKTPIKYDFEKHVHIVEVACK
jgi:hypothetical protein